METGARCPGREADRVEAAELDEEAADDAEPSTGGPGPRPTPGPGLAGRAAISRASPKSSAESEAQNPPSRQIAATEPAVPEADELEGLETREGRCRRAGADRVGGGRARRGGGRRRRGHRRRQAQADAEAPVSEPDDAPEAAADADESRVIRVSRVMTAPASAIFALIADPSAQPRFDGNENLQEAAEGQRVTAVGEVSDDQYERTCP